MNNQTIIPSHSPHSVPAIQPFPDKLYVVTMISNPPRFHSRYRLYRNFAQHIKDSGAELLTVEVAFGGRPFEITEANNPMHLQLRTDHELWCKENALNLGIQRLPAEAKYIAWIDADVMFSRSDWAQEALQQLQHYSVIQLFSHSLDLGPNNEPIDNAYGWIESIKRGFPFAGANKKGANLVSEGTVPVTPGSGSVKLGEARMGKGSWIKGAWHSGYAWAARRDALNKVGGLIDYAILGSADRNMAAGLFGFMEQTIDPSFSPAYKEMLLDWQTRTEQNIRRNVGQMAGTIIHAHHGPKSSRGYTSRWKILSKYQFDPHKDLMKDSQGLWQLRDHGDLRSIGLRDEIRNYFRSRNEDSNEA